MAAVAPSITVFGLPACTDVARVLACLFEKEVEFQLVRTDNYKGDHKVPDFLKLQDTSGQVTYKEGGKDGKTFTNSRQICRHVADKFKDQGNKYLLGTGGLERASVEQWLLAEEQSFEPPSSALVFSLAFAPEMQPKSIDPYAIEVQRKKLAAVLDVYDKRLSTSAYLAGDEFTLADLSHLPNAHYLVTRTTAGRQLFEERENVKRWWGAISSQPSWKKVVQMQSEHPGPLEKLKT